VFWSSGCENVCFGVLDARMSCDLRDARICVVVCWMQECVVGCSVLDARMCVVVYRM
jgi:hypothetical protein